MLASLEFPFERDEDGRLTSDRAFEDNAAVIGLWRDPLHRQPRRFNPIERADQFSP
jgi:hypothetical protein